MNGAIYIDSSSLLKVLWNELESPEVRAAIAGYATQLRSFRSMAPFEFLELPGTVFRQAVEQHLAAAVPCRSLDRLHLACMSELGVRRLMTHDGTQAAAARAMKYQVVSPGH